MLAVQVYRSILCHKKLLATKNRGVHVNQVFQPHQYQEGMTPQGEPTGELEKNFLRGHVVIE